MAATGQKPHTARRNANGFIAVESNHSPPPEIASLLAARPVQDKRLKAALRDYREACARSCDVQAEPDVRAAWSDIRDELEQELMRFAKTFWNKTDEESR